MTKFNPHDWNGHVPEPEPTKRDLLGKIREVAALVRHLAQLPDEMDRAHQEIRDHPADPFAEALRRNLQGHDD